MPRFADRRTTIIVALMATSLAGCAPEMASLRQSFAHPGPAAYQRAQAIQHDPYVLNDVGPEVVGGRPREYMIPVNEVERARLAATPPAGLAPTPAPAVVIGPAPGAAPTYVTAPAHRRAAISPGRRSNRHNAGPGRAVVPRPTARARTSVLLSLRERISSRGSVIARTLSTLATVNPSLRVVSWYICL